MKQNSHFFLLTLCLVFPGSNYPTSAKFVQLLNTVNLAHNDGQGTDANPVRDSLATVLESISHVGVRADFDLEKLKNMCPQRQAQSHVPTLTSATQAEMGSRNSGNEVCSPQ